MFLLSFISDPPEFLLRLGFVVPEQFPDITPRRISDGRVVVRPRARAVPRCGSVVRQRKQEEGQRVKDPVTTTKRPH